MAADDYLSYSSSPPHRKRQRSPSRSPTPSSKNPQSNRRNRHQHDLSVEVCKDFNRSICRRAEIICKFAHPPSNITIDRFISFLTGLLAYMRLEWRMPKIHFFTTHERSASLSHSDDGSDDIEVSGKQRWGNELSVEVCNVFIRSNCRRVEIDCKFTHPPSFVTIERGKVIVCSDSLRNKCFRGLNCSYFRPPLHIQASLLTINAMEDTNDQML